MVTLAVFTKQFHDKYYPRSYQLDREREFLTFQQDGLSVSEYEARFSFLSRYAMDLVNTDEKRCQRFKCGLIPPIATRLTGYRETSYVDLVDTARKMEKDMETMKAYRERTKRSRGGSFENKDNGAFRNEEVRSQSKKFSKPSESRFSKQGAQSQGSIQGSSATRLCFRCSLADHLVKDCVSENSGKIRCFGCGEHGHTKPQCPKKEMSKAYKAATRDENRTGRVFTLVHQPTASEGTSGI